MRTLLPAVLLVLAAALPGAAQPDLNTKQTPKQLAKQKQLRTPAEILNAQVDTLMRMSPEQREKVLAKLPPERRQALEQRLAKLDHLRPDQRAELDRRFLEFQMLPPLRRQAIREEMTLLRRMRPVERRARLMSPEFRNQYSPQEIQLMRDVWNLP